ncbi:ABC transporter [Macleaya cordata]|uniref:ABC transporter n=1 Tax=Macleaya cordata TaxID=56857 RepID=A0A200QWP8_MACCD|nr:ABC transporter [Macleaya cordata]
MNIQRYREAIRVCCLEKDLEMMEFGDQTEIGERGINLSGGQKQRIQLARAVYQDCDIYLLDDIFSAVDAHTGSEIFKECVRGALKNKTILLVTHQVDFLHNADLILVMRDGMIVQSGKYDELVQSGLDFGALVAAHATSMELVEKNNVNSGTDSEEVPPSQSPHPSPREANGENGSIYDEPKSQKKSAKLIEDEERETGHVSLEVYKTYCTEAFGWWGVVAVLLISLLWQSSLMASDYWLAYETGEDRASSFDPSLFIRVYGIIAVVSCVLILIRSLFVTFVGLKTAQIFFRQILNSILHAPMSFFDTTPSGRVLSRASSDQTNIDLFLPFLMSITVSMYITVLSIIIIICQVAWPTIFLIIPLGFFNFWYRGYYLASSRELTRLDSITKAPVIQHFSESVSGVMTIRCFNKQSRFCQENIDRVNANLRMDFHNNGSNEWLGFRLELIGSVVLCLSALFMVLLPSNVIKPEYVGLSLSYGLSLNSVLFWAVYISCFVENRMVSVERVKQFINIPSESPWVIKDSLPPPDWPNHGDIDLKDLQVRYRPNTPLILKGITLSIQGGEKIGVVGRTGSGKSTLIQAFFRVMEPSGGKIIIDGVDISKLGLHDLRSRYGIIPQEPVLFEGTVRSNVDPIGLYSDDEIWKSLERCQLKDVVAAKPEKLDSLVVDSGDNWSVGQRQLLCLGRVMLKRSRILFMDEATASVDSQTDGAIQRIIREDFSACTIISIAHRIPTVMDCDRVLVIDAGHAKEFDKPSRLLERHSLFGALVQEYANRSSGFPFLLKSIEIYRSPLPFRDIDSLSNSIQSNQLYLPCRFQAVFLGFDRKGSLDESSVEKLGFMISEEMVKLTGNDPICGGCGKNQKVSVTIDSGSDCIRNLNSGSSCLWSCGSLDFSGFSGKLKDDDEAVDDLLYSVLRRDESCSDSGGKVYTVVVINREEDDGTRVVVGKHRHAWLLGKVSETNAVSTIANIFVKFFMNGGKEEGVSKAEFMPVGADGRIVLSFSLLNANPQDWIYDWDFQKIDEDLLAPVVEALAPVANLSVESQVLYHTPKSSFSYWDAKLSSYVFSTKDLPFFVNSNEWHLDTSIAAGGRSKVLQFVVYIPSAEECPLRLQLPSGEISMTNGFISPMWGGVIVWNPPSCFRNSESRHPVKNTLTPQQDIEKLLKVFMGQLRQLFGLNSDNLYVTESGISNFLSSERGFTEWELDVLSRQHTCFNLLSCVTTLGSLSKLVQSLPRMIIMDEIGKQVKFSLEAANLAQTNASLGIYEASAVSSRQARALAEDAFFHPSIMSISYYSFEHCFAIYTPFFLPVSLHILLAATKEWRRYKQERAKYLAWTSKAKAGS